MRKTIRIALFSATLTLLVASPAAAQRGGRGGDRGGDRGGFGGGDFRARILERIDANGNGVIEPNEAQGRAQGFIERMARDAGLEPGRPLPIQRLIGGSGSDGRSRGEDRSRGDDGRRGASQNKEDEYPTIPRFGDESVAGFGLSPMTLAGKIIDLEKKYDRRVLEYVNRTMDRYDKDKNGILDHSEWASVSWRSDPRESDLDKDGMLTKAEMAERMAKRFGGGDDRGDRGRGDRGRGDRGRGDRDRGDRDRGDRDREDRGRGGFGGDRGGFGRRGGFDPTVFIARMDKNENGRIDPDEIDERRRNFFAERFQIDFSKPVEIETIRQRFQQRAEEGSRDRGRESSRRSREQAEDQKPTESYRVDGSTQAKGRKSYRSEGRALPKQLPEWWDDRDGDDDGQITLSEFASSTSDQVIRDFKNYDINGDGLVTAREAEIVQSEGDESGDDESGDDESGDDESKD